jgi:hypothetical protein
MCVCVSVCVREEDRPLWVWGGCVVLGVVGNGGEGVFVCITHRPTNPPIHRTDQFTPYTIHPQPSHTHTHAYTPRQIPPDDAQIFEEEVAPLPAAVSEEAVFKDAPRGVQPVEHGGGVALCVNVGRLMGVDMWVCKGGVVFCGGGGWGVGMWAGVGWRCVCFGGERWERGWRVRVCIVLFQASTHTHTHKCTTVPITQVPPQIPTNYPLPTNTHTHTHTNTNKHTHARTRKGNSVDIS